MSGCATAAVQTGTFGDAFHNQVHFAIGITSPVAKDQIVRPRVLAFLSFLQTLHQNMGKRNNTLLPVLRRELPLLLSCHAYEIMTRIEINVLNVTNLLIAESGAENELENICLILCGHPEHGYDLFRFIDRPDGLNETGPIALLHQLLAAMPLEELENRHHLVLEATVRFGDNGSEAPLAVDLDLLEEVDAVGVLGSVE
jgi:hypothetical protein